MDIKILDEIKNRTEKATQAPWRYSGGKFGDWVIYSPSLRGFHNNGGEIAELDDTCEADAEFIAHAREDIPKLLSEIKRLHKVVVFLGKQVEKDKIFINNYLNKNKKKK